jgi:hypothetical protein
VTATAITSTPAAISFGHAGGSSIEVFTMTGVSSDDCRKSKS